jgi:ATP-binding cassette subfamily F protein 3
MRLDPDAREQELRDHLGGFGFAGDQALMPSGPFSGGEKSRLVLAMLVYQRPNLLLLDEPTNHLDLEMRQALAVALQDFSGAMVIVSHDRHLLRVSCDRLMLVHDSRVEDFALSLDDYPKWLDDHGRQAAPESAQSRSDGKKQESSESRKVRKRMQAEQRERLQPLRNRVKRAEAKLAELQIARAELDRQLADPELYDDQNKSKLQDSLLELARLEKESDATEAEWMLASEELEALGADCS